MQSLSSKARATNLSSLENGQFDVLVIGGGVTGAGVAVDAAARGYKVALVEKADFASGTSSKATKLVHGGVRYLANFDFGLVHEALVERGLLLQNAPFLVQPLAFVLPMYEGDRHPVGMPITTPGGIGLGFLLNCGLLLYDILAGRRNVHRHRHLTYNQVMQSAPSLVTKGLRDGYVYYDAQTNDVRLTMTLLHTAARFGVTIANYAEVTSFVTEQGKVQGAIVRDHLADKEYTVRARHIISAAGVFTEKLEALTGDDPQVGVEPSKGVHLVFSREDIQLGDDAIVLPETDDKRILFIVPWESRVLFGTTDTGTGDLDHPTASPEDISYLLRHLNRYLSTPVTEAQIVSAFAGYRPLVKPKRADQSTAKLSRSHVVLQSPSGLISIFGGKLTTYRRMAQDAVDVISQRDGTKPVHPTMNLPLAGSAGWPTTKHNIQARGQALKLDEQVITHLGSSYGTEAAALLDLVAENASLGERLIADLHYIRAEVIHACRQEMAMTPYDVLARRTSILLLDRQQGEGIVDEVAAMMAQELNWTADQQQSLAQDYRTASKVEVAVK